MAAVQQTYNAISKTANNNAFSNTTRSDYDVRIGKNQDTNMYDDIKGVCEKKGKRLCTSNEICDMKKRQTANLELTSVFQMDKWIAVWAVHRTNG